MEPQVEARMESAITRQTNDERRAERLRREIAKQHNWRITTWAQAVKFIEERQQELLTLGHPREELWNPDFENPDAIEAYANRIYPA